MSGKTLYVTDLDGTLLNTDNVASPRSIEIINRLVEQGMLFTYATARSLVSASVVTKGLAANIPVIVYNGAFIMQPSTGKILAQESFSGEETEKILSTLEKYHISPLVYSLLEGEEKVSWCTRRENDGIRRYLSLRKNDRRLRPLSSEEGLYDGEKFYYTCIGEKEELQPVYDILSNDERFTCILQQELYRPEYWCEIMPRRATKAEAIRKLKELWGCDRIVSFGDALNDIPMFEISDECYAVANAVEELKRIATGVIAANDEDGVAEYLLQREGGARRRRVRYSGSYPKRFEEKYKELNPDRYEDTVKRVMEKGSTPAGMHISICVREILDFLQIKPGQTGLDATLGYGGHTGKMLECLEGRGHLYALDIDPIESEKTKKRLAEQGYGPEILTVRLQNFSELGQVAQEAGPFDFILADLGVSSMQIDNPERGFSYKTEGPLDLRMNPQKGISAAERLRGITEEELRGMLMENADEPYAAEISRAVRQHLKKGGRIDTTTQLCGVIESALGFLPEKERKEALKKSCQRTFQALRIDVNQEFESLYAFLENLPDALAPGGRVAILTFHSGEDRLVKKAFRQGQRSGVYREISTEVIRPSAEECRRNPRAKSTKMRWAIRA